MPATRHLDPDPGDVLLLVGTVKGAFIFRSDRARSEWEMGGPYLAGSAVYAMAYDGRDGRHRVWAGPQSMHWGALLRSSDDFGRSWTGYTLLRRRAGGALRVTRWGRDVGAGGGAVEPSAEGALAEETFGLLWGDCPGVRDRVLDERGEVRPHVDVFVDGEDIRYAGGLGAPLRGGAEILILPAVSGG